MFTPQQIAQNIEMMIKAKYPSISKFLEENNLQKNTISNMKSGSMPSADKFAILALSLHVTPDFLLGIQDEVKKENAPTTNQDVLVQRIHALSTEQAKLVLELLDNMRMPETPNEQDSQ